MLFDGTRVPFGATSSLCRRAVVVALATVAIVAAGLVSLSFAGASPEVGIETSGMSVSGLQRIAPESMARRQSEAANTRIAAASTSDASETETGRLLIRFIPDLPEDARAEILAGCGLRSIDTIPQLSVTVAELKGAKDEFGNVTGGSLAVDLATSLTLLQSDDRVAGAELDRTHSYSITPNDPYYGEQWALPRIGLPNAWNSTTGSPSVTLAIIDSGLGVIPEFAGRVVSPYSVVYNSSDSGAWVDLYGHGTACAGVAAAAGNNATGIAGAAWNVSIMPIHDGETGSTYVADAAAFVYAADHGADIINYSSGGGYSSTVEAAVEYAQSRGAVVVASAGNDGAGSGIDFPASMPGVIAVGATNSAGNRATFSSTGDQLDLAAPGEDILTWWFESASGGTVYYRLDTMSGTSFSAPLVSGLVGLMLSRNPSLTAKQIEDILAYTADDLGSPGWDSEYGDGLVNAAEAVTSAGDKTAPVATFGKPTEGSVLKGTADFVLSFSDNISVAKVEQYLDGEIQFTCMARSPHYFDPDTAGTLYVGNMSEPVHASLDTTDYADGSSHVAMARVYDSAGNSVSSQVRFVIDNRSSTTTTVRPTTTTTARPTTTTTTLASSPQFSDVPESHPYSAQIADLAGRGIVGGFPNGTFQPDSSVTRQQFAKMIVKTLDLPVSESDACPFLDVPTNLPSGDPLYPDHYVAVCAANGITTGKSPSSFAPFSSITRAQLITMVSRSANLPDPDESYVPPFAKFDNIHYPFARRAAYAGLLNGLQGIGPDYGFFDASTRGEVCAVLYNLLHR